MGLVSWNTGNCGKQRVLAEDHYSSKPPDRSRQVHTGPPLARYTNFWLQTSLPLPASKAIRIQHSPPGNPPCMVLSQCPKANPLATTRHKHLPSPAGKVSHWLSCNELPYRMSYREFELLTTINNTVPGQPVSVLLRQRIHHCSTQTHHHHHPSLLPSLAPWPALYARSASSSLQLPAVFT